MAILPFLGPTYAVQATRADAELAINLYPEKMESPGATSRVCLLRRPGVRVFVTLPTGPIRALFDMNGRCFAVGGEVLYEISLAPEAAWSSPTTPIGVAVSRGVVATDANPATICTNGDAANQLFITSGNNGYILDLVTNVLTFVVADVLIGGFLNGYFYGLDAATSTLYWSDLNDGLTWDPTNFAQRSLAADQWNTAFSFGSQIWLFGEQTTEVWQVTSDADLPFQPVPGAFLEQGAAAAFSPARLGSSVVWLGQNEQGTARVYRAQGYAPAVISTRSVEYQIGRYTTIADAQTFTYQEAGHEFYVLNFPTANATWVYDATEGLWHTRDFWNTATATSEVARPQSHAHFGSSGVHLVGDRATGTILVQSIELPFDPGGADIRTVRESPHYVNELKEFTCSRLTLNMDVGLGNPPVYSAYYVTVQASHPRNYWRLGERTGTTAADVGTNPVDGTYSSTGVSLGQISLVGDLNPAILTDGATGAVDITGVDTLALVNGGTIGLALRFQPAAAPTATGLLFGNGTIDEGLLIDNVTGALRWRFNSVQTSAGASLAVGETAILVGTFTSLGVNYRARLYKNGTLVSNEIITMFGNSLTPTQIGGNAALSRMFGGVIDEGYYDPTRIWDATEIAAQAAAIAVPTAAPPEVMLQWSKDGGQTWSPETWRPAGVAGRYATRVFWTRIGQFRDLNLRLSYTGGAPPRFTDLYADVADGRGT